MEPDALIKSRVEEASKFIPFDQLCLSPQCGFSSTVHGNKITPDEQEKKLELVVRVAEDVVGNGSAVGRMEAEGQYPPRKMHHKDHEATRRIFGYFVSFVPWWLSSFWRISRCALHPPYDRFNRFAGFAVPKLCVVPKVK